MATLANSPTNVAEESWVAPESWSAEATRPDLFTDTACSKETQYLRRKCFNCQTSETPSWRRSASDPSKVVCNKCGLYERTMLRPRLLRCPDGKQGLTEGSDPSTLIAPMDPLEALARLQSFDGCFSPAVLSTVQLVVDAEQARAALLDGMSDEIFATLVAMAFLSTKLGPDIEWDSWGPMYEKARAFVEDALQNHGALVGVDELQAMAISMLA
ncbi:hypothetical protein B0H10DRAFT_1802948 [Mycena sp. CBHHK59/15]|nr:hypothetical protein B0H10DRAFT_1802948 [Mycena sp. CBHHK59/15]